MKANELRIGNKVSFEGSIVTVNTISDDEVTFSDYASFYYPQIEDISGIELTEEWLVRFGFSEYDQMGDNYFFAFEKDDNFEFNLCLNFNDLQVSFYSLNWERAFKIKSVHQLQNLYFALTGEELEPKQA
jgi:hypothetical protein